MDVRTIAESKYIHWGVHSSLYSGKTRSYLIKKGIEYVELNPSHPHYSEKVQSTIGYYAVPVLETSGGEIIQDSTEIIEFLEKRHPEPSMLPKEKPLQALAWIIHNYGTDGLINSALHYRWGFGDANHDFILDEFNRSFMPPDKRDEIGAKTADFSKDMDQYLVRLGVTDGTISAIEGATKELYKLLDKHFRRYPYLLGGRPSIADFGMMSSLFAHLGRDPYPSMEMKLLAPALYRWTETMNRPGVIDPELWNIPPTFFSSTELPETLIDILRLISTNYGPELVATNAAFDAWLEQNSDRTPGTYVGYGDNQMIRQPLGEISHEYNGAKITRHGWPDILLTHQRVLNVVSDMTDEEKSGYESILSSAGDSLILSVHLQRRLTRRNYSVVLAE